ncbi:MAG TPA: hypothetical protein VEQ11_09355 [Chloroflexota bacterium]|nr:hypothetical protein [Chloroflexota bacterium]HYU18890.1 hypothetical protein [Chloroflexota bacterium]
MRALRAMVLAALLALASVPAVFADGDGGGYNIPVSPDQVQQDEVPA